jgi:peroxiredoxin
MRCVMQCGLLVLCAAALVGPSSAQMQIQLGTPVQDFPPGPSTDGVSYHLSDFAGKVVVLYFFEKQCPTCKGLVPERNAVINAYKDKPIKFIAISPGGTLADAAAYVQQTKLAMPVFADSQRIMEKRYGFTISLQNIHQTRIIGPDGKLAHIQFSKDIIDKVLADTKADWKYKGQTYDAKLGPAVDAFEWGQFPQGMKVLTPARKSTNKTLAESANKLFDELKKDGEKWKAEGDKWADSDPVQAYDNYSKVASVFAGDDLGKSVADPVKKLSADKSVSNELAARKGFATIEANLGKSTPAQKAQAVKALQDFAKKFPNTPTGDKAAALAKELGG